MSEGNFWAHRNLKDDMSFRACLVLALLIFVPSTMCTVSKQQDYQYFERIDSTVAVVGRIFVYSLTKGNEGSVKVSDEFILAKEVTTLLTIALVCHGVKYMS